MFLDCMSLTLGTSASAWIAQSTRDSHSSLPAAVSVGRVWQPHLYLCAKLDSAQFTFAAQLLE